MITLSFEDFFVLANGSNDFGIKLQESLLFHRDEFHLNKAKQNNFLPEKITNFSNEEMFLYLPEKFSYTCPKKSIFQTKNFLYLSEKLISYTRAKKLKCFISDVF